MQRSKRVQIHATNLARSNAQRSKRDQIHATNLARSNAQRSKEIRFKQQTLQGPEEDHLT